MKHTRSKSNEMKRHMRMLAILLVPVVALILGAAVPACWAQDEDDEDGPLEFDEAKFNIEFNSTDEDLGVQAFVDGEPVKKVIIRGPKNENSEKKKAIFSLTTKRGLKHQGIAELFFESGEPTLEEVSIQEFLARFPEGTYEFIGRTIENDKIEGEAEFTHVIPCGPEALSATGGNVPDDPIIITWSFVEKVVDLENSEFEDVLCIGTDDLDYPADFEIVGYRVEVEWEDTEEIAHIFSIDLGAEQNLVTIPPEFIPADQDYDFEVLAIEASGNQTITEEEATAPAP